MQAQSQITNYTKPFVARYRLAVNFASGGHLSKFVYGAECLRDFHVLVMGLVRSKFVSIQREIPYFFSPNFNNLFLHIT